ncbi:MAG: hypothetical protein HRT95_00525 [Moritella sp.]|uniref:hypothetical protein n=1 Tax=Moritella sp. TaxID=78556 RepID=UPI001D2BDCAB|nr:hypothetical protein [Moritella sp.]NQZ48702.1 hypothetical protein [Moritella sp.]
MNMNMNVQELFLVLVASFTVANMLNIIVVNPFLHKLKNVLFGNPHEASKHFQVASAKGKSMVPSIRSNSN